MSINYCIRQRAMADESGFKFGSAAKAGATNPSVSSRSAFGAGESGGGSGSAAAAASLAWAKAHATPSSPPSRIIKINGTYPGEMG